MAKYLIEAAYSQVGLKALVKDGGTGVAAHLKTIVLLTPAEVDRAAKKSTKSGYRAPGGRSR